MIKNAIGGGDPMGYKCSRALCEVEALTPLSAGNLRGLPVFQEEK